MAAADRKRRDLLGETLTSLCGGALALNVLLILALLGVLAANGLPTFWQRPLALVTLTDGSRLLGEVQESQPLLPEAGSLIPPEGDRFRLKIGNRDLYGADFRWVDSREVASVSYPPEATLLERLEWGAFFGTAVELRRGESVLAHGPGAVMEALRPLLATKAAERNAIRDLERGEVGDVNHRIEDLRLEARRLARGAGSDAEHAARGATIAQEVAREEATFAALAARLDRLRAEHLAEVLVLEDASGTRKELPVGAVLRAIQPNAMGTGERLALYAARVVELVRDDPRESNTEGGIFPAIFGTVMMVFLMSFAVAPLGVLAALYLREYARQGTAVRMVRIAVNNLAGVPSIVFGVFGLGFFVYVVGGSIDRVFFPDALPTPTFGTGGILWASLTLALLTVPVVVVATEEGLAAVPRVVREGSLALGATKFETTWRVVIPAAAPGILTGMILAMARAAGEVAPLMIVGMVKLAPALPVDYHFPFVHLERKFMHLGFHIFDVGFQSPNVEATKPLVFATALLLVAIVTAMNLTAILVRNHLRRKYVSSAF
jgi:phosphate transport system permease protein